MSATGRRESRAGEVQVACFGNVLRGDDGFGNAVAQRLLAGPVADGVRVTEVGIGGIHLVQQLLDTCAGLVVVDSVQLDRTPGTVVVMRPDVLDVNDLDANERRDQLADMHYSTPERVFMLAQAMGTLPEATFVVGCQPVDADRYGQGLSDAVAGAVGPAVDEVRRLVREEFTIDWE